ncbi:MAG TPA: YciI family protein [Jatrophihabitans sp.]|nr:YciI family protein [Jatrophihabitans sp.]
MRVMVLVKADEEIESGRMPTSDELAAMTSFNEELVKAGVMLAGEGLAPTTQGKRVRFDGKKPTVIDGPFTEAKELVAGYWIWEVASMEEATEWLKRAPFQDTTVEIRRVFEDDDFGDEMTPELRAQEQRIRDDIAGNRQ